MFENICTDPQLSAQYMSQADNQYVIIVSSLKAQNATLDQDILS